MAFNKVILIGNITKDLELKQTPNGVSVCSFDIAVNRKLSKDEVDFISIVAWRQQAEFVTKYFKKGQAILVCGQIQTRSYTDSQNNKRTAVEVVADEVTFAGGKESSTEAKSEPYTPSAYVAPVFNSNSQNFEEIQGDESLPF